MKTFDTIKKIEIRHENGKFMKHFLCLKDGQEVTVNYESKITVTNTGIKVDCTDIHQSAIDAIQNLIK